MNISYSYILIQKLASWFVYGKLKSDLAIFGVFLKGKGVKELMNDQENFQETKVLFEANGLNVVLDGYGPGSFLAYAKFCILPANSETSCNFFEFILAKEVAEKISKKYGVEVIADFIFGASSISTLFVFKVDITYAGRGDMGNVIRALQRADNIAAKALKTLAKKAVTDAVTFEE